MIRNDTKYDVNVVLDLVRNIPVGIRGKVKHNFDGDAIKLSSDRLFIFAKSINCIYCGIEGKYFYKERNHVTTAFHFNLYAIDKDGNEVLMTKDHIVPRAKGGKDKLSNYQTCCIVCNNLKATTSHEDFIKQRETVQ